MPHQLRRIIAINIRNATTGLPSERVAEMDLRGSALAVGANGAGKTTFLRLLPLFYGATPQQILRGSGRSSLIAYSLPSDSSAVAFEYERESAADLRCVVMHCDAGEDRPVFRIIENGGFKEEYFYDKDGYFVTREDFPARAERLGAQLSQKLPLNLYRSVILKERLHTKEGMRVRDLSERHSLGARPLPNLDQIAAAMANEKISFADLRNIVIDRVLDMGALDRPAVTARELRKSHKDVEKWLADLDHLNQVMAQAAQAQTVKAGIDRVKDSHRQMCALHLAVRQATSQVKAGQEALQAEETLARENLRLERERIEAAVAACKGAVQQATPRMDEAAAAFEGAKSRQGYFASIDAPTLASRQDREAEFASDKTATEAELARLTSGAGAVRDHAESRSRDIKDRAHGRLTLIGERELQAARDRGDRLSAVAKQEEAALHGIAVPARLAEIPDEREANVLRLGALEGVVKKPAASEEAEARKTAAHEALNQVSEQHLAALGRRQAAAAEVQKVQTALDAAVQAVNAAKSAHAAAGEAVERVRSHLTPTPGSLLEYLRRRETDSWGGLARVIDPGLLERKDLNPEENAVETGEAASVPVGALMLDVRNVAQPGWVDTSQLTQRLEKAQQQSQRAGQELEQANQAAQRARKAHEEARAELASCEADVTVLEHSKKNARQSLEQQTALVQEEAERQQQQAKEEIVLLKQENAALEAEKAEIESSLANARESIKESFRAQRSAINDQTAIAAAFEAERKAAQEQMDAELEQLARDVAAQLKGLGIDPQRITELEKKLAHLAGQLQAISLNRHLVIDWRVFERDELPRIDVLRVTSETASQALRRAKAELASAQVEQEQLSERQRKIEDEFVRKAERLDREERALKALLESSLKDFLTRTAAADTQADWDVSRLEREVSACKQALEQAADDLVRQARRLRDVMTRHDSPVSHWIDQRERELPDPMTLLDHEARIAGAQVLCDWFLPGEEARVSYINQISQDMDGFLAVAGNFVQDLDIFESRIRSFNKDLQAALQPVSGFRRFKELSVEVLSSMGQIGSIGTLRQMQQALDSKTSSYGAFSVRRRELPTAEEVALIRRFREILPRDGVLRIDYDEQVRLECALTEGGKRRVISNDEEFRAVSSNGNTALIVAMFLIGFLEMVRKKDSGVRMTWLTDECGRFDAANLREFLHVLDVHNINVISAAPSADPAQSRHFQRLCMFEDTGAIGTTENISHSLAEAALQGEDHVRA